DGACLASSSSHSPPRLPRTRRRHHPSSRVLCFLPPPVPSLSCSRRGAPTSPPLPLDQAALALGALAAVLPGDDDAPQRTALGRPTSTQALAQLKAKLLAPGPGHVGAAVLAEPLQIPADQAALALRALAAVLPGGDDDPTADGAWEADLHDVLLFLYIQSYKRLVPRLRFHPFAPV
uniref:Uncharacterized protein n=2 Tax=Aegilops tauschii subsp. strangulata TaxID=200361 RepID=A0A453DRG8_AEGTS